MKKILLVFMVTFIFIGSACSSKICYRVSYNGNLIEERNYENGILKSIIAYNLSDTKDSIVYDGEIKLFNYIGDDYSLSESSPFSKYYYPDFDKSVCDNYVYGLIKSNVLLENVIWALASIDDKVMSSGACTSSNRIIKGNASNYCIEYKNLNTQCQLPGIFQTFNTEKLRSLKIVIKNGLLKKMFFKGEETDKRVLFDYSDGFLQKEKIYYYTKGESKPQYMEQYAFSRISRD